ncbi:MAG: alcohol dehydrogenase catalytic domain-containing protein [Candidatus Eisenbacteria sp.]|nr:alcohol dehydrogenase catalytic domain-containing protein [Candidatus Eisenbacteria bacterium]
MARMAILTEPGKIVIEDRPAPEIGPREALVRVRYAGVCGTDLAIYSGSYPVPLPVVLGHEFCGEVVKVGAEAPDEWLGRTVTAEINNTCLSYAVPHPCKACASGLPNHCRKRTVTGIICADGAFQEYMKVPAANLHELPGDLDPLAGAFVEPMAAAIQTFELAPIESGQTVVVLGAGRLGILVIGVAHLRGARVIALSRHREDLELARAFGADEAWLAEKPDPVRALHECTGGLGAPVVVEATGSPDGLKTALLLVAPRGTIALKSTPGTPADGLDVTKIAVDEIRIQGSRCGPFSKAIDLLRTGTLPIADLTTSTFPLGELAGALKAARNEPKVIIDIQR